MNGFDHKATRSLLKQFITCRVSQDELKQLIAVKAPFLSELLRKYKCPIDWDKFVLALASSSAVCAIIHPGNELQQVLTTIADGTTDLDIYTLHFLQQNCPVILNLLQKVKPPQKQLSPVLYELLKKANAPFNIPVTHCT